MTKNQNDFRVDKYTYTQNLNISLSAMGRQVFDRQKCFQYTTRMFAVVFLKDDSKTL